MRLIPTALAALSLITSANTAWATGIHRCETTQRSDWLSKTEITNRLEANGWRVRRVKEDGGCWEVYGTNPDGKRVEGYFHPVTGAAELISQRGTILYRQSGN